MLILACEIARVTDVAAVERYFGFAGGTVVFFSNMSLQSSSKSHDGGSYTSSLWERQITVFFFSHEEM